VNRRRHDTHSLPNLPDQPSRVVASILFPKNCGANELVHPGRSKRSLIVDYHLAVIDANGSIHQLLVHRS
jgi:hypothetical protein